MSLSPILTSAAFAPIRNVGWIRITGSDRVRWLNGMVTNNIAALQPGEGCYNFFLNAQGRIQGDATAWMLEDSILLETAADRIPALIAMLDHFIIMDDVELADITSQRVGLAIFGRKIAPVIDKFVLDHGADLPSLQLSNFAWTRHNDLLLHADSPQLPRFEIWFEEIGDEYTLGGELSDAGILKATPEDLEQLRILSGTPLYGTDIRDKELPQETAQTGALHFTKGCYLGQEIVERIRSRGNVHRTFSGFILTGELPTPGAVLSDQDKPAGELTSVTRIELPTGPMQLALGYIRREALESTKARGTSITYPGGTATPTALPFQLPESRA
jgi:folate-binding protein YgfZ